MQLSKITALSILALATPIIAVPTPVANVETAVEVQDENVLDKRFGPIALILGKVIFGTVFAGAAKAGVDVARSNLEPEAPEFKTWEDARTAFTKEIVVDLYAHRYPANVRGIACYNGPYSISEHADYRGPMSVEFKWDVYKTDYDCIELISGSVTNKGDGGYINTAVYGTCNFNHGTYTC